MKNLSLSAILISVLLSATATVTYAAVADSASADLERAISAMSANDCSRRTAHFTVTMPQMPDDVNYDLTLTQMPSPRAELAPCEYLIDWQVDSEQSRSKGFSAYFDGNHFRFDGGERLQEYHLQWDSIPFMPQKLAGLRAEGVQRTSRFTDVLPAFIAERIGKMMTDSAYHVTFTPDTLISGTRRAVISTVMNVNGTVAMEGEYVLDRATLQPLRVILENNPGAMSEQTITITYSMPDSIPCTTLDEKTLIDLYPEEFSRFRRSNFTVENLRDNPLPAFSLPTSTAERYTYHRGDGFRAPTLIAMMDPTLAFNSEIVEMVRNAVDSAPTDVDVIWAFTGTNIDEIEAIVPSLRQGEHLLINARGLARDCGAATLPVFIIADTGGRVADVIVGYNNQLTSDVIQKIALIR